MQNVTSREDAHKVARVCAISNEPAFASPDYMEAFIENLGDALWDELKSRHGAGDHISYNRAQVRQVLDDMDLEDYLPPS